MGQQPLLDANQREASLGKIVQSEFVLIRVHSWLR